LTARLTVSSTPRAAFWAASYTRSGIDVGLLDGALPHRHVRRGRQVDVGRHGEARARLLLQLREVARLDDHERAHLGAIHADVAALVDLETPALGHRDRAPVGALHRQAVVGAETAVGQARERAGAREAVAVVAADDEEAAALERDVERIAGLANGTGREIDARVDHAGKFGKGCRRARRGDGPGGAGRGKELEELRLIGLVACCRRVGQVVGQDREPLVLSVHGGSCSLKTAYHVSLRAGTKSMADARGGRQELRRFPEQPAIGWAAERAASGKTCRRCK